MIGMGVRPADLAKFEAQLDAALLQAEEKLAVSFRRLAHKAYAMLVENSPQWSGDFASNWNLSVNRPDESYFEIAAKADPDTDRAPFRRGMDPAKSRAMAKLTNAPVISFRDTVYITNATPRDEGGSLGAGMEGGSVKLRPANLVDGRLLLINYTADFLRLKGFK